ncbi:MAG: tRNA dihydrouridine synthase DusB [Candidatus Cloacimonetes bacterium]|nr:tRNA dihydrouridine synthase DusB [Candidatus Cloacimonadota bacterium]
MLTPTRIWQVGNVRLENAVMLAPMEGYSELPFRRICRRLGASMVFTEFTSSEGLVRLAGNTERKIRIAEDERPVGIQIYGRDPGRMANAARIAEANNPELVDINFGCPAKKVTGGGCGSQLMREPEIIYSIVSAVRRAVSLPVTCKLRLGWDDGSRNVVDVCRRLQDLGVAGVAIHGRTRCQKYLGQADWEAIARVREALEIPVIGNGDVASPEDAQRMFEQTGVAAVMIGRAAIHNPWIFRDCRAWLDHGQHLPAPDLLDRLDVLESHLDESVEHKGEARAVLEMRKMYASYLKNYHNIRVLRGELMQLAEVQPIRDRLALLREELLADCPGDDRATA